MPLHITIIGGLDEDIDRATFLELLHSRTDANVEWTWVKAESPSWNIPPKEMNRLLGRIRNNREGLDTPIIVKLYRLHGRDQDQIYRVADPKLAPSNLETSEELIDWLLSPGAQLIPKTEWSGSVSEAALAALLSKLIRNKSWNKDQQGHAWTKEADLLGQSPVTRPGFEPIRIEAEKLLRKGNGNLFLSKGGSQGNTPKEWCINHEHVPLVKRIILSRSFDGLEEIASLNAIHRETTRSCQSQIFKIDGMIVTEPVLYICQK